MHTHTPLCHTHPTLLTLERHCWVWVWGEGGCEGGGMKTIREQNAFEMKTPNLFESQTHPTKLRVQIGIFCNLQQQLQLRFSLLESTEQTA